MIYKFRVVGTGKEPFYRNFETKDTHTFLDFHNAIQTELQYDRNQLASFFLANSKWEKGLEINLLDMTTDSYTPVIIMEKTQLCELLTEENQRLLYVFDFFSDRAFFIELLSIGPEVAGIAYPRCTEGRGDPPEQIIIEDIGFTDI